VLAIAPERVGELDALRARERAPWAQLGTATSDGRLVLTDQRGGPAPVDVPLELVLGKPPRMVRRAETIAPPRAPLTLGGATVSEALDRVLGLPTVADKTFLVTIGDRTVGGLVSRDPMIGRFQVPVADHALTTAGFEAAPVRSWRSASARRSRCSTPLPPRARDRRGDHEPGLRRSARSGGSSCRATGWPPPVIPVGRAALRRVRAAAGAVA
jgi:phosphoribosylformylglycinamidine (FGAM) synthase-like enzyme